MRARPLLVIAALSALLVGIRPGGIAAKLTPNGAAWAWGGNQSGQLGNGDTTGVSQYLPVPVTNDDGSHLSGVLAIAAGEFHSLAMKADGTVWAWGWNSSGQLGNSDVTGKKQLRPVQVSGLNEAFTVAAGFRHSLALQAPFVGLSLQPNPAQAGPVTALSQGTITFDLTALAQSSGLGAWSVDVAYDPASLQPTACTSSNFVGSNCNLHFTSNRVRVSGAAARGLPARSALASLTFTVLVPPNSTLLLTLHPVTLTDATSQALGATIRPALIDVIAAADVNHDGTVDTVDALCVLRFVGGLAASPPGCPANLTSADFNVNRDKTVDATDALCVLLAVNELPATKNCPAFAVVGTGVGDTAARPAAAAAGASDSRPRWGRVWLTPTVSYVKHGDSATVAVKAQAPAGLGAWTVDVVYDAALVKVSGCEAGGGIAICNPSYAPGVMRIAGTAVEGRTSLVLATITFTASDAARRSTSLTVRAPTLADATGAAVSPRTSGARIVIQR